ncbi:MAG: hypothetical protein LAT82_03060 [Nanoarchaeota archaeon]|nr:hypothetical protein [Nanoarchaeota archaeon]
MHESKVIKLDFKHSGVNSVDKFVEFLKPTIEYMKHSKNYINEYASLNAIDDEQIIEDCLNVIENIKGVDVLVVIGIGGSNLGTVAIYDALKNVKEDLKLLLFADTTDSLMLKSLIMEMRKLVFEGKQIALNVISKSGTTTETLANFYVLYDALKQIEEEFENKEKNSSKENLQDKESTKEEEEKNEDVLEDKSEDKIDQKEEGEEENKESEETHKEFISSVDEENLKLPLDKRIIVTTDKGSKLYILGRQKGFYVLTIPKLVGGRYSVFSNVGIFPLMFSGIEVGNLLDGAKDIKSQCLKATNKNPALISATSLYLAQKRGQRVVNMFVFSSQLFNVGQWYRQLFAESLGKKMNANNSKEVRTGMVPTCSVGSTDLHSVAQLYLGGPNMTYHQFITIKEVEDITISKIPSGFELLLPSIFEKSVHTIMGAIYGGVEQAFINEKIPFDGFHMEHLNEYTLGTLMQFKMIEVMLLAKLWGINAFDQPSVELYKEETRKLLDK